MEGYTMTDCSACPRYIRNDTLNHTRQFLTAGQQDAVQLMMCDPACLGNPQGEEIREEL
jgi:hypothetical protein